MRQEKGIKIGAKIYYSGQSCEDFTDFSKLPTQHR